MPYQFQFYINNQIAFQCQLDSQQCIGHNQNGSQCRRKIILGTPYCFQHLEKIKHLQIKTSTIPNAGKGLFAYDKNARRQNQVVFHQNTTIIDYGGEYITAEE